MSRDDFSDLSALYKQDVDKLVKAIRKDEEEDEKVFQGRHLSYLKESLEKAFDTRISGQTPHYRSPRPSVPLWLFTLLGVWAIAVTVLLGVVVNTTSLEGLNLPIKVEIQDQSR
jgi:hypothetical protein